MAVPVCILIRSAPRHPGRPLRFITRMKRHDFKIMADYYQFYLADNEVEPEIPEDGTDEDVQARLKVAPHIMVVYPVRNMPVPVAVEFHDSEPITDAAVWDHIAECSLEVPSGRIVIAGCTDYLPDCARLGTVPGTYRARVHYGALGKLSADGLDGDDHYLITFWPAPASELRVTKRYVQPGA